MRNESAISAGWLADCSQTTTHNTHTIIGPINIKWALTKYGHFQALNDNSCPFVSLLIYIYSISLIFKEEEEGQMKPQTKQNKTERNEARNILWYFALRHSYGKRSTIRSKNNRNSRKFQNVNNWAETQHRLHFYASISISKFWLRFPYHHTIQISIFCNMCECVAHSYNGDFCFVFVCLKCFQSICWRWWSFGCCCCCFCCSFKYGFHYNEKCG